MTTSAFPKRDSIAFLLNESAHTPDLGRSLHSRDDAALLDEYSRSRPCASIHQAAPRHLANEGIAPSPACGPTHLKGRRSNPVLGKPKLSLTNFGLPSLVVNYMSIQAIHTR